MMMQRTKITEGESKMRIIIPVNENKQDTSVCTSFGRAPYYLLYDTENNTTEYIANPAFQTQSGAGVKAAQLVVDQGANALLTVRCGQNAATVLNAAEVEIYKTMFDGAAENLEAFQKGNLSLLKEFHPGYHKHQ
jgi:predicted Fe-Mo cluster-binding NifX family protein